MIDTELPKQTELVVAKGNERRNVAIDPQGITIGRSSQCDIVLGDQMVSKVHARLYLDPFGRWIIEDLASHNGTWIGHEQVEAQAVLPGEEVCIGPFSLLLSQPTDQEIPADPTVVGSTVVEGDDSSIEMATGKEQAESRLSRDRFAQLNAIVNRLAELTAPTQLYPETCRCLAMTPDAVAMVVRVPKGAGTLSCPPQILACCSGPDHMTLIPPDTEMFHVSCRTIEAVRSGGKPVMASSFRHSDKDSRLSLTVVDEQKPRSVYCSPIAGRPDNLEVLYLDLPMNASAADTLDFVQAVTKQVSLARKSLLLAEARTEKRALDQQLRLAHEIQSRLAPRGLEVVQGVDLAVEYRPAMWVGGDYYDTLTLPDGRVAFAVGDVSGKGLPAALLMANLQAALRSTIAFCPHLSEALSHVNRLLLQNLPEGMFVTLFLGLFDPGTRRLEYVNAGHVPPFMLSPEGSISEFGEPVNLPLGISDDPFVAGARTLESGGGVVVVTDGITEARSPAGQEFGLEGLCNLLAATGTVPSDKIVRLIDEGATAHRQGLAQQDDVTVLALMTQG